MPEEDASLEQKGSSIEKNRRRRRMENKNGKCAKTRHGRVKSLLLCCFTTKNISLTVAVVIAHHGGEISKIIIIHF